MDHGSYVWKKEVGFYRFHDPGSRGMLYIWNCLVYDRIYPHDRSHHVKEGNGTVRFAIYHTGFTEDEFGLDPWKKILPAHSLKLHNGRRPHMTFAYVRIMMRCFRIPDKHGSDLRTYTLCI